MLIIILVSIIVSLIFAPLGCISLWKKYTYFGDGLSHASLLSGSISLIIGWPITYSGSVLAVVFAAIILMLKNTSGSNAVISLVASFMLSIAFILASAAPWLININHLLFGDILAASSDDLIVLLALLVVAGSFIVTFYDQIILIVLNRDIARVRQVKVKRIEFLFLVILSLSVFLTIKIVGALLITSILLIPAMTARMISKTPWQMIIASIILALAANLAGLYGSFYLDLPVMPTIVIVSVILYFCFYLVNIYQKN